ncbi:hypothetical protein COV82_04660 [Candidatus Peregrinibacteria bacterium CG11_big_fil_rev_8_21_14_0_20_46_8]|nr:MAG: hypothetical protein COV82_04660 [Candidatus Peregrinibacteria bacterium CG11_big_fil_rev_8_21_14_0_20_46_8]
MKDRSLTILNAIIKEFIATAQPVGSQAIVMGYKLSVSPATVRNEMAQLEHEGYIMQPHTSAGRIPTDSGYRLYVNELADYLSAEREAEKKLARVRNSYKMQKAREKIYDAVNILSQVSENVGFATLPDNRRTFFLGVSNVLKQPEFISNMVQASQVMEVLEDNDNFVQTLRALDIGSETKIFIGKENILAQIHSCAMVVSEYRIGDFTGYVGILGPTRMEYPFNHAVVGKIKRMLEEEDI